MLKYLCPQIEWDKVGTIGFDLDGTLYDEYDFIAQVYVPIASQISLVCGEQQDKIYQRMLLRWLEKGSSYNRIFDEVLSDYGVEGVARQEVIGRCIQTYRGYLPVLNLTGRAQQMLTYCRNTYPIFLVSDGSFDLQMNKFQALGLGKWFEPNNVYITGEYGAEYAKPSTNIIPQIELLKYHDQSKDVVYLGDREIDRLFADQAGFRFVKVSFYNMEGYHGKA